MSDKPKAKNAKNKGEENRLAGRVRRYARMTGAGAGLAARVAAERVRGRSTADAVLDGPLLRNVLGNLKGPVMKVAQILATVPGMLPDDVARDLADLQANAPAMGASFVRRRMRGELGPDWQTKFKDFDMTAARAASLGQVHRATALDGRALAVKLQYPDMASTVEADLAQLDMFLRAFTKRDKALDTSQIREEVADRLREELDYIREAKQMALFRYMLMDEPRVHIPAVLEELSTDRMLVMTWEEGTPVKAHYEDSQEDRDAIARKLFRAWYIPLHKYGIIHGDPHPGNYTVRGAGGLNLVDFGCVRVFDPKFISGVIDLYYGIRDDDKDRAVHAYETWGFEGLSREVIAVLNEWAEFLYGPITDDRERLIDEGEVPGQTGKQVAIRVREELQRLGPVTPPREFVFMDRAAVGIGSVLTHLGAKCNWHEMFEGIIADYSPEILAKRQAEALKVADL